MACTWLSDFRPFPAEIVVRSLWTQKEKCRAFQGLSVDVSLMDFSVKGLDPAGPLFESQSNSLRLGSSDAKFVDVIHTSSASGIRQAIGHLDFYPNGGRMQPGCGSVWTDVLRGCSHDLAIDLFADSMMSTACQSVAYECDSYLSFQQVYWINIKDHQVPPVGLA